MATAIVGNKAVKSHDSVGSILATDLSEFTSRMRQIEPNLAEALVNGQVKVVDSVIYSAKSLEASTTVELMEAADQKKVGFRNLNKRQLEANTYFLLTGIQLLVGTKANASDPESSVSFSVMDDPKLFNGEFELKQGDKILFPRNSMEIFRAASGIDRKPFAGYYRLECPKMLIPLTDIVPTIWLPTQATANTVVKIVLHGVRTNG